MSRRTIEDLDRGLHVDPLGTDRPDWCTPEAWTWARIESSEWVELIRGSGLRHAPEIELATRDMILVAAARWSLHGLDPR